MTSGTQCDMCRTFGPSHAPGWFYLAQQPREDVPSSFTEVLFGRPPETLTFCRVQCLAEWAYVHAVAEGPAAGTERAPKQGTGWPS